MTATLVMLPSEFLCPVNVESNATIADGLVMER
jgi:hypothetical protein